MHGALFTDGAAGRPKGARSVRNGRHRMENERQKYIELYLFLWNEVEKLIHEFEDLRFLKYDAFFPAFGTFVEKLRGLADHCAHVVGALQQGQEPFQITDELCGEADAKGLAARDFSIGFLQRTFCLGFHAADELREALCSRGKLRMAYLAGDVLCKG